MSAHPSWLRRLTDRYDPAVLEEPERALGVRLVARDGGAWEVALAQHVASIRSLAGRPDAVITGDTATWRRVAAEPRLAVDAYLDGRLTGAATCTSASGSSRRPARRKDRCGCAFAPSPHAARACRWWRPEKGRRRGIDLLDALELDRARLIGNSLGGRVALEIALRDPDRVGRLALLAPALAWRAPTPMGAAAAPDPT